MVKRNKRNNERREIPVKEASHFSRNDQVRHRIAQKAYGLYEHRGCCHGYDLDDWLEAEQLVLAEINAQTEKARQDKNETGHTHD